MKINKNCNIDDILLKINNLINLNQDLYITSVGNSQRRQLSRNLKPTKCKIELHGEPDNNHHNNIGMWLYNNHIIFINTKNKKRIPFKRDTKDIFIFTTEKEAIEKYNELIDNSKQIFYDIIAYRESLKIKKN